MMGALEGTAISSSSSVAGGSSDAIGSSGAGGTMAPTSVGGGRKSFFSKKQKRMLRRHTKKVQAQYKKFLRLARKFKGGAVGAVGAVGDGTQVDSNIPDGATTDSSITIIDEIMKNVNEAVNDVYNTNILKNPLPSRDVFLSEIKNVVIGLQ